MRRTSLFVLLAALLTSPALAQAPDTTSAWRYLSLDLGNAWEYEKVETICNVVNQCDSQPATYTQWRITGEAVVGDTTYWTLRDERYDTSGGLLSQTERLVRFDTTLARAVERVDGVEPAIGATTSQACRLTPTRTALPIEQGWPVPDQACRLDTPFDYSQAVCDENTDLVPYVGGGYGELFPLADGNGSGTVKHLYTEASVLSYAAGVGLAFYGFGCNGGTKMTLTWARVDGQEIGAAVVEEASSAASGALGLVVAPNPSRGDARVEVSLTVAADVRAELFDGLGRRVAVLNAGPLAAGSARFALPDLPPGTYLVRATSDVGSASAAVRIVR